MNFQDFLQQLFLAHGWKAALSVVATFVGSALLPVSTFLAVGVMLVMADWITGVTAAIVRGDRITSRGLMRTMRKVLFYSMAIVLVLMVERAFFPSSHWMVYLVSAYIALVELFSNLENISSITGTDIAAPLRRALRLRLPWLTPKEKTPPAE
jgi:phage-related holin